MAALQSVSRVEAFQSELPEALTPVARLAMLHGEAQETARLANVLGRSVHVAIAFAVMATATLALGGNGFLEGAVWAAFVTVAIIAIAVAYRRTIRKPFERAALKSFSQDLNAILVFSGFAWGAGSFLALPAAAGIAATVAFSAGAGVVIALLLREQERVFLFLAPVAALTSFACVLRPLAGGALDAAMVLIACSGLAALVAWFAQTRTNEGGIVELAGFPQT
ncbi:MAG TPA: hypothetical protein VMF58_05700 [Rhizomicrobium sp.]|nr:hypothetical protein [Rhizomicrobium sp.]